MNEPDLPPRPLTEEEHRAIMLRSMSVAPGWAKLANTHADRKRLLEAMDYWRQRAERAEAERHRLVRWVGAARLILRRDHAAFQRVGGCTDARCEIDYFIGQTEFAAEAEAALRAKKPPAPSGGPSP